jgi:uncharacterized protein YkwD
MKRFVISALTVVIASAVLTSVIEAQGPKKIKTLAGTKGDVLRLTNALRKENGVRRLVQMTKADELARRYALLMANADTKNIIVDYSPLEKLGTSWAVNFASHDRLDDRHNAAFVLWATSSRDRANMLNGRFVAMGSGYAVSKSGKCYYSIVLVRTALSTGVEAR